MKEIDDFVHTVFSDFAETDDVLKLKKETNKELTDKYNALIAGGMKKDEALIKIKTEYGARECVMHRLHEEKSVRHFNTFKRIYPKLKNSGIIAVLAVTVFAMVFAGTTEMKLEALTVWIILIIALVFFEIIVEYIDYWYGNRYNYVLPPKTEKQLRKEKKRLESKRRKEIKKQARVKK